MHAMIEYAKAHKVRAALMVVGALMLVYIVMHSITTAEANSPAALKAQLASSKLASQTQIKLADISAQAAETPYKQQTAQAGLAAEAQKAIATVQAGVANNSTAAQLSAALAQITGNVTMNAADNATQVNANNDQLTLGENTNAAQVTLGAQTAATAAANIAAQLSAALASITGQTQQTWINDNAAVTVNQQNNAEADQQSTDSLEAMITQYFPHLGAGLVTNQLSGNTGNDQNLFEQWVEAIGEYTPHYGLP